MSTYEVELTYTAYASTRITLPDGKRWEDVREWYIKWNTLHVCFIGETEYREIYLCDHIEAETKRPDHARIMAVYEDGAVDYENPLVED